MSSLQIDYRRTPPFIHGQHLALFTIDDLEYPDEQPQPDGRNAQEEVDHDKFVVWHNLPYRWEKHRTEHKGGSYER